jgi:phage gp46-like protein
MADFDETSINIRSREACEPQPFLLWDSFWIQDPITHLTAQGGYADWGYSDPDEDGNKLGLRARAMLHTATLICLFTDKRAPADAVLEGDDARGWWGDGEAVKFEAEPFERELGSHLWMLERGTLTEDTALIATEMCQDALMVLIEQGIVARTEVEVEPHPLEGQLLIGVRHFSHDGSTAYDQKFSYVWRQNVKFPLQQTLIRS